MKGVNTTSQYEARTSVTWEKSQHFELVLRPAKGDVLHHNMHQTSSQSVLVLSGQLLAFGGGLQLITSLNQVALSTTF